MHIGDLRFTATLALRDADFDMPPVIVVTCVDCEFIAASADRQIIQSVMTIHQRFCYIKRRSKGASNVTS